MNLGFHADPDIVPDLDRFTGMMRAHGNSPVAPA